MRKQIVHISIHQTSKVIAAMHAAMISVLFVLPVVLGHWFHGEIAVGFLIFIFIPLFIWLFLYIGYVIACWFYNLVVPCTGGIEFDMIDISVPQKQTIQKVPEDITGVPDKIIERVSGK
jgi:hypothetical protein